MNRSQKLQCARSERFDERAAPHPARALAHDILNMLGVIRAHAELALCEDPGSPVVAEHAGGILEACSRASELAVRLWPAGRNPDCAAPRRVSTLQRMAADVLCWLQPTIGSDIEIKLGLNPATPAVLVDVPAVEQALYNLMRNACQAMPGGGVLRVWCGPCAAPKPTPRSSWCRICVQDTGAGITPAAMVRLGRSGFTTHAASGGRGIGLASVNDTVRAHGGLLRFSSTSHGSVLSIFLPCGGGGQ